MSLIIIIQNDGTGTNDSANYNVKVRVNDRVIDTRRVEGHRRSDGWEALVRAAFPPVEE